MTHTVGPPHHGCPSRPNQARLDAIPVTVPVLTAATRLMQPSRYHDSYNRRCHGAPLDAARYARRSRARSGLLGRLRDGATPPAACAARGGAEAITFGHG
jgi:hypothetical protein